MTVYNTNQDAQARIAEVKSMVADAMSGQSAFLTAIQNATGTTPPPITPPQTTFYPNPPVVDATAPTKPIQVDSILTETQNKEPAEPGIITNFGIAFPTGLDDIQFPSIMDWTFAERDYVSSLLDAVATQLELDVTAGGTGLTAPVEDAIYNRDALRRELARQQEIDQAMDEFSGRGFSMPPGVIADAVYVINEKYRMDLDARSKDIVVKNFELALQNKWNAIEKAIGLEGILVAHHDNVLNRALQAATSVLQLGADIVRTQVAVVTGKIEAYKSELDARVAVERFKLEKYTGMVNVFAKKVDATLGRAKAYIDLYQADTQVYSATIQKAEAVARLLTQQGAIVSDNIRSSTQIALEAARANLQAFIQAAEIRMAAAKAGADIYAAQIASANGAISTVIQLASSGETIATESSTT